MFSFFKNKIKDAFLKIKKEVEKAEEVAEEPVEEAKKPYEIRKPEQEKSELKEIKEEKSEERVEEEKFKEENPEEEKSGKEKTGFFGKLKEKIITTKISENKFEDIFEILEMALMENNVALEVIEKIKEDLKNKIVNEPVKRGEIEEIIRESLVKSLSNCFIEPFDILEKIRAGKSKPFVICFVGINGTGKTTTIAKIARLFQDNKLKCVIAASDTFRAASIEQLQHHADALKVKMIKHDYGADPAAVAYDAVQHARAKGIDVVLIDTAGRMHSNTNLMDEVKKIKRVVKPDLTIFVGESITGNDCIEQASSFNDKIGVDAVILSKADVDEKGGAAVSISYVIKKPILYLGIGQNYKDLKRFDREEIIKKLGLED